MQKTIGPMCVTILHDGFWVRCRWVRWRGLSLTWAKPLFSERMGIRRHLVRLGRVRVFGLKAQE